MFVHGKAVLSNQLATPPAADILQNGRRLLCPCSVQQTDRRATILQFQEELKSRTINGDSIFLCLVSKATVSLSVCSFRAECKGHTDPTCLSSAHCSNATNFSARVVESNLFWTWTHWLTSAVVCVVCLFRISLGTEKTSQSPEVPEAWFDGR